MTTRATRSPRRRTVIALGVVLAVLAAFVVRLVDIQVVNAQSHIDDSVAMGLGDSVLLRGVRGSIVDSDGTLLAKSTLLYDAQFSPINVKSMKRVIDGVTIEIPWEQSAADIAGITGQTPEEVMAIVSDALAENAKSQFAYLKRGLSTEQYRDLAELGLPYLSFEAQPSRVYPDGAVAGNLIGFVGVDGDPLDGLELQEDSCLTATDGIETFERGSDGVVIPGTLQETPAADGGTLQLTIDGDLQWFMQQLISEQVRKQKAKFGTVTVVEVATGKVRAAAEYPSVDPNDVNASDPEDRQSRLFIDSFEPGSTFKAITAATVMDAKGLNPMSTVTASGSERFSNGAKVNDSFAHGPITYTLAGALIDSSNVALSKFGTKVSPKTRYKYLQRFGVGEGTAIEFPGQTDGVLHPVSEWDNQSLYTTTFGQHFTVTAPQVASAYQAIANDGVRMPLSIIESCTTADGTVVTPDLPEPVKVVKKKTARATALILENVLSQGLLANQVKIPGYRVAGKTGTAQKPAPGGGYKAGLYYTTLVGFAPAEDPQYVVIVTLDEPRRVRSSAANAEGFQKAMTQVLKTYRVLPSSSKTPKLVKYK